MFSKGATQVLTVLVLGSLLSCGAQDAGAGGGEEDAGTVLPEAFQDARLAGADGAQGDAPVSLTDGGGDDRHDDVEPDADATTDVGVDTGPSCPGGTGCACSSNDLCDVGLCLETPDGRRCAQICVDSCSAGFACAQLPLGSDVIQACVSRWARLCEPCTESKECSYPGLPGARCLNRGQLGDYCGAPCNFDGGKVDGECPQGYACTDVADVDENVTSQCVPVTDKGEPAACTCSANDVTLGGKTPCAKKILQGDGELVCSGRAQCKKAGDAPVCQVVAPTVEACDGIDNDCDGQTDEAACDDQNACTLDVCKLSGRSGSCVHTKLGDATPCDADGSVCTVGDACKGGTCKVGTPLICDDKNPCTKDSCHLAKGCTQVAFDGIPCSDGNPCTIGDVCKTGSCAPGKPRVCTSTKQCLLAQCDPTKDGSCEFPPRADGATCSDGDGCTHDDACVSGSCRGKKIDCDDGDLCTDDACDGAAGCGHEANTAPCEDGDKCTAAGRCKAGTCTAGALKSCDDHQSCTVDSCDAETGECVFDGLPLEATPCNADRSVCTVGDACKSGKCLPGAARDCNDGNVCTVDACADKSGCTHLPATGTCSDGDGCTLDDACSGKVCAAGKLKVCDDDERCTADSCAPGSGQCVFAGLPRQGSPCDADGSLCTVGDACALLKSGAGKCAPGPARKCDDGNPCTDDGCSPAKGCTSAANVASCDDDDKCTTKDRCANRSCEGRPIDCDDHNPCTEDRCDPKVGCNYVQVPDETSCAATGSAWCQAGRCRAKVEAGGACKAGKQCKSGFCADKVCCDSPCTESCRSCLGAQTGAYDGKCAVVAAGKDPDQDCKQMPVATCGNTGVCDGAGRCARYKAGTLCAAATCSSGVFVNVGRCGPGGCARPAPVSCDDKKVCTTDACDPGAGCKHAPNTATCDADGDLCTAGDACKGGVCKAGTAKDCDDSNPCTKDGCAALTGDCTHGALPNKTSCGAHMICDAGKCVQELPPYLGGGQDGPLLVDKAGVVVNASTYVTAATVAAGQSELLVKNAAIVKAGDEVLIHQVQAEKTAGTHEYGIVAVASGHTVTLRRPLTHGYTSGTFDAPKATVTQLVRVPHFTAVTVKSGASIVAPDWNGHTGGVVVFRASGVVQIKGSVIATGRGFRTGRQAACGKSGMQGEGYFGTGGISTAPNYGGGGGSISSAFCGDSAAGGSGGGGYGTAGQGGQGCDKGCGYTKGGSGGGAYGDPKLGRLLFGGAAGSNGRDNNCGNMGSSPCVACGSDGGGIVRIVAQSIVVMGAIHADGGSNGASSGQDSPGPSAGAGGSIYLSAKTVSLGTKLVTARAGAPGKSHWCSAQPAAGAVGRIRVDADQLTGKSSPGANTAKFKPATGFAPP